MGNIYRAILCHEKKVIVLIFLIAFLLRLTAVMNLPEFYQTPASDAKEYDTIATDLLAGKGLIDSSTGLPTSRRPPLYPLFLAFIYLIFGHSYVAVRLIQCIMGAFLCIIVFNIAKLVFDKKIAFLSAVIIAFYQPYIYYSFYGGPGFLLTENLFIFLLGLLVLHLIRNLFVELNIKNSLIAGVLIGLLTLTKSIAVFLPIVLFGLVMLYKNKYPFISIAKRISPLFIGFLLVLLPWTVRNFLVHRSFVPLTTMGGNALLGGNNPYASGGGTTQVNSLFTEEERAGINKMSEVERDNFYRKHAKEFLFKNYKKLPKLFFKKMLVLWDVYIADFGLGGGRRIYNIWYAIVFSFGLLGIAQSIKSKLNINSLLLILLFLYISSLTMMVGGDPRYRYPFEANLVIFAGAGIFMIYNRFKNKFLSYVTIGAVIGINLLIYTYSDLALQGVRYLLRSQGI